MKSISILIDNPLRELDGVVLLAYKLAVAGYRVSIVPFYQSFEVFLIKPDLVIVNYVRTNNLDFLNQCLDREIKIGVLDTEGGVIQNYEEAFAWIGKCITELQGDLLFYAVWGQEQKNALIKTNAILEKKIIISGTPRYDFCNEQYQSALNDVSRYYDEDNMILVNTNYPILRPRFQSQEREIYNLVHFHGWNRDYVQQWIVESKIASDVLIESVKKLAISFQKVAFVLRPHPFEDDEIYNLAFKNMKNIYVIREGTVLSWIASSRAVIQRNCSTAIEACLMDKISFGINWPSLPTLNQPLVQSISFNVDNLKALENYLKKVIKREEITFPEKLILNKEKIIKSSFRSNDGKNTDVLVKAILELLSIETSLPMQISFLGLLGFFYRIEKVKGIIRILTVLLFGNQLIPELKRRILNKRNNNSKRINFDEIERLLIKLETMSTENIKVISYKKDSKIFCWRTRILRESIFIKGIRLKN